MPSRSLSAALVAVVLLSLGAPAIASPLGIDLGFCQPFAEMDVLSSFPLQREATFGSAPYTRKLEVSYRYTVPSAGADKQALIDQTDEVRLCKITEQGLVFCPDEWLIYHRLFGLGHEPTPDEVSIHEDWTGGEMYDPAALNEHRKYIIDHDWLEVERAGTVIFFRINDQDVGQALRDHGFCPLPYLVRETPDQRFRFYGVKEGTTNPQLDSIHLDLCRDGSTMPWQQGRMTCMGETELDFLVDRLADINGWQEDHYFGGLYAPPTPPTWRNGPDPCVASLGMEPFCGTHIFLMHILGAYRSPGQLRFSPDIFVPHDNLTYSLTDAAAFSLSTVSHEYTHAFQAAMCREGIVQPPGAVDRCQTLGDNSYPPFFTEPFIEGAADGPWICLGDAKNPYPGLPPDMCASGTRLTNARNRWALGQHFNPWLDAPHSNLLRRPYDDYLYWAYLSEAFATPRNVNSPNPAHPPFQGSTPSQTTDSLIPVPNPNAALGDPARRPDEGHDIRARVAETLQTHYFEPGEDALDAALQQHLGRTASAVATDLASAMVLKDFLPIADPAVDARFVFQWLGSHTADGAGGFPLNAPVATLSDIKLNLGGMLPVEARWEDPDAPTPTPTLAQAGGAFDYVHRMHRDRRADTWRAVVGGTGLPTAERLFFSNGDLATGAATEHLRRHGAVVISARPRVDPLTNWGLHFKVWTTNPQFGDSAHNMRMRVFLVDSAGQPQMHWACQDKPEGLAPQPTELCNKTSWPLPGGKQALGFRAHVPILSGGTPPSEVIAVTTVDYPAWPLGYPVVSWQISTSLFVVKSAPAFPQMALVTGSAEAVKQPVALQFSVQDEEGAPVRLDDSELRLSFPGCFAEPCTLAGSDERVQLSGLDDGSHQVVVTLPDSFYPPPGTAGPVRLDLRVEAPGLGALESADAIEIRAAPPRTAVVLAIDESDAMAEPERLAGAKVAAELVLRSLRDEDAAAVVTFGRDAYTLQSLGSFCDVAADLRETAVDSLESLDPAGCASLGDGLLEAQSALASALDDPPAEGPLAECLPERQLVLVLSAQSSAAGHPGYAYYAPLDSESPTTDGAEADPSCGPDDDPSDNEPWYAGELRRPQRAALGLPVPTIAALAVAGGAEADELHALVHAAGGASSLAAAGTDARRTVPAALLLADAARSQVGAATGYQRVASFYALSPSPVDLPTLDVEAGAGELLVSVASADGDVSGLTLVSPSGLHHAPASAGQRAVVFRVAQPDAGSWTLSHDEPLPEPPLREGPSVFIEQAVVSPVGMIVAADSRWRLVVDHATGAYETGRYAGAPVALRAILTADGPVTGASVQARVTSPLGATARVTLFDDGQHDDGDAGDGVFAATYLDTLAPGAYQVRFLAAGSSALTDGPFVRERAMAFALHDGEDGDGDGLPDWWERMNGAAGEGGDLADMAPEDDDDHDGLDNLAEYAAHTSPRMSDSDGGGEADGSEVARGADPLTGDDDGTRSFEPRIAPGNEKGLVALHVPSLVDVYVEVERGPSAEGPFALVFAGELPEDGIVLDATDNEVTVCYRTRISAGELFSGWSQPECVLPRTDPYPPSVALEVVSAPAPGASEAVIRITASDSPDWSHAGSPLANHPLPSLVDPDAELSGVTEMLLWTNAGSPVGWQPYQREVAVALADPEYTPVYVKVRDAAGNESQVAEVVVVPTDAWPHHVIVADNSIWLRQGSDTSGNVAVLDASSGPVLADDAEVVVGLDATLQGALTADSVRVKASGTVIGDVFLNQLLGDGTVEGTLSSPLLLPLAVRTPPVPVFSPGSEEITLAQREDRTLEPGAYAAVKLRAGTAADPTVLTLVGGSYDLLSLDLGDRSRVECSTRCSLRIADRLSPGQHAYLGPATGTQLSAGGVEVVVTGINGSSGNLGATPKAATIGYDNTFVGRIHVPNGTLLVHQGSTVRGTLIARDVQVGIGVVLTKE